ncbi:MAG: hypothetical protein HW421_3616 [Ignavibacteria bacterium]|nr:hypothetical protein [Ignavibacteria bacterium]
MLAKTVLMFTIFASVLMMNSCITAREHRDNVQQDNSNDLTVGKVQREIKKGMSGADVAEILGSPNIVTKDEGGDETWVYDKIATEATYSQSNEVMFLVLYGYSGKSGSVSTTQKTLTVVIKFDDNKKIKSFSYHASKF